MRFLKDTFYDIKHFLFIIFILLAAFFIIKYELTDLYNKEPISKNIETTDRKSTRLNSSHVANSYAVFCLKKKIVIIVFKNIRYNFRHCQVFSSGSGVAEVFHTIHLNRNSGVVFDLRHDSILGLEQ